MNINEMVLAFINSNDIAEHLKNIDYQFSTPEAAFLVYCSHRHTFEDKVDAWKRIINEMPDCSMDKRMNMEAIDSIHHFLEQYIKVQNDKLAYFYDNENSVYCYAVKYVGFDRSELSRPFSSFDKCFSALKKDIEQYAEDLTDVAIIKEPIDRENDGLCGVSKIFLDKNFRILKIEQFGLSEDLFDIDAAFDGMWFNIPTPFKKGDIVVEDNVPLVLNNDIWGESYINENPKDKERRKKLIERLKKNGDITDMSYSGCWLKDDGFYYENGNDYLSLEYYRKPLTDEYRFLKVLSMYFKNECNLEFLNDAKNVIYSLRGD